MNEIQSFAFAPPSAAVEISFGSSLEVTPGSTRHITAAATLRITTPIAFDPWSSNRQVSIYR